eukprot:m.453799 g.453799  ORF g.453799 m.453799 type:complete len:229 (-) comp21556_c0_seq2:129-815(-)
MDRCFLLVVGLSSCCATAAIRNPFMDMTSEDLTSFGQVVERLTRKSITMSEARCGPIDVAASRGSGAAYYWCTDVIKGTPNPLGLSYGIERWDTWSKYLATDYKVKTHLFDCFMPDVVIPQYPTPHEKFPTCLANRSYVDASGRRFEPIGNDLADRDPLSTFVKIDIEGMVWVRVLVLPLPHMVWGIVIIIAQSRRVADISVPIVQHDSAHLSMQIASYILPRKREEK